MFHISKKTSIIALRLSEAKGNLSVSRVGNVSKKKVRRAFSISNVTLTEELLLTKRIINHFHEPVFLQNKTDRNGSYSVNNICGRNGGMSRKFKILLSTSDKFVSVTFNWLVFYNKVCGDLSLLYILCLDKSSEIILNQYRFKCSHVYHTMNSLHRLWLFRIRMTKRLLDQGYDILLADVDAIWLRNPFPILKPFINRSIIISQRATFPQAVADIIGATVCMGFVYIKSTNASKAIWVEMQNNIRRSKVPPDDQKNLNYFLRDKQLTFPHAPGSRGSHVADTGNGAKLQDRR